MHLKRQAMPNKFEVSLDNCHKEPIHIPGSIQSHGYLLVVDPNSLNIQYLSENFASLLGKIPSELINANIAEFLDAEFVEQVKKHSDAVDFYTINPLQAQIKIGREAQHEMTAVLSRNNIYLLIELEQSLNSGRKHFDSMSHLMKQSLPLIVEAKELDSSFKAAVDEIRNLTGFDRVMLYKFDHEYNGQVVAEAKKQSLNSFLHQHFPESDIPKQARELYVRNPIRLLADVDAQVSRLYPLDKPVDLSSCILRSVSPIHCQYLRNMGVKASMSISVIIAGKLWGLIACHHYSIHVVPFEVREVAQYMSLMMSSMISLKTQSVDNLQTARAKSISAKISEHMSDEVFFVDGLRKDIPMLLEMLDATGVAWRLEKKIECHGETPTKKAIDALFKWIMNEEKAEQSIYYTHNLPVENPEFTSIGATASGVLFLPLSVSDNLFIMWFRKELIQTKNWGGKPEKVIEFLDDGSHRLMPRSSFRLWQENVRNKSEPWKETEISCALKFRNTLVNYVLEKSERLKKLNLILEEKVKKRTHDLEAEASKRAVAQNALIVALKKAEESNRELERFAFVASHDLQEPLRKIQMFAGRIQLSGNDLQDKNTSYLKRIVESANRMQDLIKGVLSFSRINRKNEVFDFFDGSAVIDEILNDLELLIVDKKAKIEIIGIAQLFGDRQQIQRLLQNLLLNALKFVRPEVPPHIKVKLEEQTSTYITLSVTDNGIGFNNEFKERIFNLFERLHPKKTYEGTGLGLAICRKIVERHHGKIWAESIEGKGTSFYFTLPLQKTDDDSVL